MADTTDASAEEPLCMIGEHDWRAPTDLGFRDSPLVRRGDRVIVVDVCARCGVERNITMPAEDFSGGEQSRRSVSYPRERDIRK